MNKELIIQAVVITTTILFPFITGIINIKKEQKRLVLKKVRS
jgi:hypothetical protein